ncbi:hypothetical protein VTI28DRAFT_8911 [Corynascus sepedonium]
MYDALTPLISRVPITPHLNALPASSVSGVQVLPPTPCPLRGVSLRSRDPSRNRAQLSAPSAALTDAHSSSSKPSGYATASDLVGRVIKTPRLTQPFQQVTDPFCNQKICQGSARACRADPSPHRLYTITPSWWRAPSGTWRRTFRFANGSPSLQNPAKLSQYRR